MVKIKFGQEKLILNSQLIALLVFLGFLATVLFAFNVVSKLFSTKQISSAKAPVKIQDITDVTALGRIEPEGDIIHLSASGSNQRLSKVRVKEGDWVKAGQIVAVMDNWRQQKASVQTAQSHVRVAQSRLAQTQASEKFHLITAQPKKVAETQAELLTGIKIKQTIIARQELELSKVINDYEHYKKLSRLGVVSNFDIEAKRLQVKIEREKLSQAKAELSQHIQTVNQLLQNSIANLAVTKQVKPTDILVAKAELQEAISKLQQAEIDLASTYIVSPIDGQVLNINTRVGELEGKDGIVEIGNTKQMYVVGEVYESDIKYLKLGQSASIISEYGGFSGKISGVVDQIGLQINQPGIVNKDPNAKSDVRVVQVKIRLNPHDGNRVKALNNLEVRALIKI